MKNLDKIFEIASSRLPAVGVDCLLIGNAEVFALIEGQIEGLKAP